MTAPPRRGVGEGSRVEGSWLEWLPLAVPMTLLLVAAAVLDRSEWPSLVGDEATYLMAAQSLAFDRDFRYSVHDLERFIERTGHQPDGLILQSPDDGSHLLFGKPLLYPLFLAPWIALGGVRAAVVANILLLATTTLICTLALRRSLGRGSAAWVSLAVFASVTFAQVFWLHADLLMLCLVASGLALAFGQSPSDPQGNRSRRWFVSGALIALVVAARPFYAPLLLPLGRRALDQRHGGRYLLLGAVTVLSATTLAELAVRGSWSAYAGERQGYYQYTGFPGSGAEGDSDDAWQERVDQRGGNRWTGPNLLPYGVDARLTLWNGVYLLVGRHVGLLPYFLPALLALALFRPGRGRTTLLLAVLLGVGAFLLARPFNFWGGGGALANRYFLPLYPALWFLPARLPSLRVDALCALLAAPFLYPVWLQPNLFVRGTDGGYAWVSSVSHRILPYETTQNQLKPSGRDDFVHGTLWIKPLDPALRDDEGTIVLEGSQPASLLIGTELPLEHLELEVDRVGLEVTGAKTIDRRGSPGGEVLVVEPGRPRAKHPMWWRREDYLLYRIGLRSASPGDASATRIRLRPMHLSTTREAPGAAL